MIPKKYNSKFPITFIDCTFITIKFKNKIMNLFYMLVCDFKLLHNLLYNRLHQII